MFDNPFNPRALTGAPGDDRQLQQTAAQLFREQFRYVQFRMPGGGKVDGPDHIDFATTPIETAILHLEENEYFPDELCYIAVGPAGEGWSNFEPEVYAAFDDGEVAGCDYGWDDLAGESWSTWLEWAPGSYERGA